MLFGARIKQSGGAAPPLAARFVARGGACDDISSDDGTGLVLRLVEGTRCVEGNEGKGWGTSGRVAEGGWGVARGDDKAKHEKRGGSRGVAARRRDWAIGVWRIVASARRRETTTHQPEKKVEERPTCLKTNHPRNCVSPHTHTEEEKRRKGRLAMVVRRTGAKKPRPSKNFACLPVGVNYNKPARGSVSLI